MGDASQIGTRSEGGRDSLQPGDVPRYAVRHYTVGEIAALWSLSDDAVRKIFEKEPGVLVIGDQRPCGRKRKYITLRIPEYVLDRVHRRMSKV
jgi:hypothetical protein